MLPFGTASVRTGSATGATTSTVSHPTIKLRCATAVASTAHSECPTLLAATITKRAPILLAAASVEVRGLRSKDRSTISSVKFLSKSTNSKENRTRIHSTQPDLRHSIHLEDGLKILMKRTKMNQDQDVSCE